MKQVLSIALAVAAFLQAAEVRAADPTSANYGSDSLLPGEQVNTPTGQKIKVWSTEGPVRVSPPPQPFDHPAKGFSGADGVVVDDRGPRPERQRDGSPSSHDRPRTKDDFDIRRDR